MEGKTLVVVVGGGGRVLITARGKLWPKPRSAPRKGVYAGVRGSKAAKSRPRKAARKAVSQAVRRLGAAVLQSNNGPRAVRLAKPRVEGRGKAGKKIFKRSTGSAHRGFFFPEWVCVRNDSMVCR